MIEQRTPEWFAARRGKITASSVGAILGLSPHMTRDDVMRNMVREWHGVEREFKGNVATEYGTHHESLARMDYQLETGRTIIDAGFYEYKDWLGASPDGFVDDGLIEIKCPFDQRDKTPPSFKTATEQPHYYAQMQVQMFVCDKKWCDFYQWSQNGAQLERVALDYDWLQQNMIALLDFFEEYLKERENNAQKHLQDKRTTNNDNSTAYRVEYYFELKAQITELESLAKGVLEQIVKDCGEKDSDICGHKLTKVVKSGTVSYSKAIKDLLPDADLTPYTGKPSEYWRLS